MEDSVQYCIGMEKIGDLQKQADEELARLNVEAEEKRLGEPSPTVDSNRSHRPF